MLTGASAGEDPSSGMWDVSSSDLFRVDGEKRTINRYYSFVLYKASKMRTINIYGTQCKWFTIVTLALVLLLVSACGPNNTNTQPTATSTQVPVNGFGSAANHVHSLLAFPKHVLVLATHYGIFRSEDSGATWKED
jgi:hypothetical protein